ncbi:hypothetical protein JG688_00010188 [Phytophthora aleatoria]|uniref:Uncharacterized protein n=1 Tax=Phytophthora aleatoria TaxID=2496075 RepID=A0A8J5M3I1_9STRA|nr:hypothetical protein JG688_00010188 [Phytophthora aleatoria]
MQRLLGVSQMVVHDAIKRTPARENHIQPAPFMARAAVSMVGTGRVVVYSTDNPCMCRVKQIEKEDDADSGELSDLCSALDSPFNSTTDVDDDDDETDVILGPSLMVTEQRARAAHLYKSVVSWSLWYAHRISMPEGGCVVEYVSGRCKAREKNTSGTLLT